MTYPLLVTAEVARVEILGITEHAWADWVKRKVVEPVPGTRLYARRDLETAHERAKDIYAKPDNTLRLAPVQRKTKARKLAGGGHAGGWDKARIDRALSPRTAGES